MTESVNLPVNTAVQNGTIRYSVQDYVDRYKGFSRDVAQNVISLAKTLVDAEEKLTPPDFEAFCVGVDIEKGGSQHKKLRTIGKNAWRFQQHLDRLPNNWTTIYMLAKISIDKFDDLVGEGIISPRMKARQIEDFLGKAPKKRKASDGIGERRNGLFVSFGTADEETKRLLIEAVTDTVQPFGGEVQVIDMAEDELIIEPMAKAA